MRLPGEVIDIILGSWFEETDHIEALSSLEVGADVGDVHRVGYLFDITNEDGANVVEKQAYYRSTDDKLTYLRIVCSG